MYVDEFLLALITKEYKQTKKPLDRTMIQKIFSVLSEKSF